MLESAIHHCQRAGLTIGGKNEVVSPGETSVLVLTIPGAALILTHGGTRAALELMPAPLASAETSSTGIQAT